MRNLRRFAPRDREDVAANHVLFEMWSV